MEKFSVEAVQDKMLRHFEKKIKKFCRDRQDEWFNRFFSLVEAGSIHVDEECYEEVVGRFIDGFEESQPGEVREFIRGYVDTEANKIFDNKKHCKKKAKAQLEVLSQLLTAVEEG